MAWTIWKFQLPAQGTGDIEMPQGSRILYVADQRGQLCVWALVESKAPRISRRFTVIGTGWEISEPTARTPYLGSVQQSNGHLVWHVFDGGES